MLFIFSVIFTWHISLRYIIALNISMCLSQLFSHKDFSRIGIPEHPIIITFSRTKCGLPGQSEFWIIVFVITAYVIPIWTDYRRPHATNRTVNNLFLKFHNPPTWSFRFNENAILRNQAGTDNTVSYREAFLRSLYVVWHLGSFTHFKVACRVWNDFCSLEI